MYNRSKGTIPYSAIAPPSPQFSKGDKIRDIRNLPTLPPLPEHFVTNSRDEGGSYLGKWGRGRKVGQKVSLEGIKPSASNIGIGGDEPISASHSIEIFFGNVSSLADFYHYLLAESEKNKNGNNQVILPATVKRIVLVGHPLTSLVGLHKFLKLSEIWITDSNIKEVKWSNFNGISLQRLYLNNCNIQNIEPIRFRTLKVLWICENKLTSLCVLNYRLPTLQEVNAAGNLISTLNILHFVKSPNIKIMNLSGNPLCSMQDIVSLQVLANLEELYFADPVYGKCPIVARCNSRAMLVTIFQKVKIIDGKPITPTELQEVQELMKTKGAPNKFRVLPSRPTSPILSTRRKPATAKPRSRRPSTGEPSQRKSKKSTINIKN